MSEFNDFDAHMKNVEAAQPGDATPLLVAADWCAENDRDEMAFCLRWCAARKVRPFHRPHIQRNPWEWTRKQDRYPLSLRQGELKVREPSMLDPMIFEKVKADHAWAVSFRTAAVAYVTLAYALKDLRDLLTVPDLPAVVVRPVEVRIVCCRQCGISRGEYVRECPVCKATEVL